MGKYYISYGCGWQPRESAESTVLRISNLIFSYKLLTDTLWQVNMSIAILPMSAEFNWNPTTVGLIQSSFFCGYLLTQVMYILYSLFNILIF